MSKALADPFNFRISYSTCKEDVRMGNLFVNERLVDPYIVAIDSTLPRAKGHLWYKSSMNKGKVPRSGIDTDAR